MAQSASYCAVTRGVNKATGAAVNSDKERAMLCLPHEECRVVGKMAASDAKRILSKESVD